VHYSISDGGYEIARGVTKASTRSFSEFSARSCWGCDSRRICTRQVTRSCCAFSEYVHPYLLSCRIVIIHGTEVGIFLANFAAETPDSCTNHFRSSRWQFDELAGQEREEGCVTRMEHLTECTARHYRSIMLPVMVPIQTLIASTEYYAGKLQAIIFVGEQWLFRWSSKSERYSETLWICGLWMNATRFKSLSDIFLEFSWIYKVSYSSEARFSLLYYLARWSLCRDIFTNRISALIQLSPWHVLRERDNHFRFY